MAIFSGRVQDQIKMALGLVIYALYFFNLGHLNKWLYIPLDVIIVGGAIETGRATSTVAGGAFKWRKRFGTGSWWRNMKYHGVSGTLNMLFGHLAWLSHAKYGFLLPGVLHTPCLWVFYASTVVVAFTAYHMGSVAMGTVRVDMVYKVGAVIWLLPLALALADPSDMERNLRLLGYAQAFCFVRIMSPISFTVLGLSEKALGKPVSQAVQDMRWDVAASCGIVTGMLLGVPSPYNWLLMAITAAAGFVVAPILFPADRLQRIKPATDGSSQARQIDRDIWTRFVG